MDVSKVNFTLYWKLQWQLVNSFQTVSGVLTEMALPQLGHKAHFRIWTRPRRFETLCITHSHLHHH